MRRAVPTQVDACLSPTASKRLEQPNAWVDVARFLPADPPVLLN